MIEITINYILDKIADYPPERTPIGILLSGQKPFNFRIFSLYSLKLISSLIFNTLMFFKIKLFC